MRELTAADMPGFIGWLAAYREVSRLAPDLTLQPTLQPTPADSWESLATRLNQALYDRLATPANELQPTENYYCW